MFTSLDKQNARCKSDTKHERWRWRLNSKNKNHSTSLPPLMKPTEIPQCGYNSNYFFFNKFSHPDVFPSQGVGGWKRKLSFMNENVLKETTNENLCSQEWKGRRCRLLRWCQENDLWLIKKAFIFLWKDIKEVSESLNLYYVQWPSIKICQKRE